MEVQENAFAKEQEVTCPECGKAHKVIMYDRVIAPQQNDLKSKILKGEMFKFTCADCGATMPLIYPCLYQDTEKGYMVWFAPASEGTIQDKLEVFNEKAKDDEEYGKMLKQYKLRMVTNLNSFVEKLLIFDQDMDDRSIEVQKAMLAVQLHNTTKYKNDDIRGIFFGVTKDKNYTFTVIFEKAGVVTVNCDMDQYYKIYIQQKKKFQAYTPEGFVLIQSKWGSEQFARIMHETKPAKGRKYRKF